MQSCILMRACKKTHQWTVFWNQIKTVMVAEAKIPSYQEISLLFKSKYLNSQCQCFFGPTFLCLCSMAQTLMITLPPTRRTLASSLSALTLRSTVAMWCITATDKTASRLSSRKGRARLSQCKSSLSFSLANWARDLHRSDPMLNTEGLTFRYLPLPQPGKEIKWLALLVEHLLSG